MYLNEGSKFLRYFDSALVGGVARKCSFYPLS